MNAIRLHTTPRPARSVTTYLPRPTPLPAAPPPIGAAPIRYGNGRIELQLYPAATAHDRIAAAALLLSGTGFAITPETETR
jgi:hypothetical protein